AIYTDPDVAAARAAEYVSMGFTGIKFDPAGPYTVYDGRQVIGRRIGLFRTLSEPSPLARR
ncbi:MAG: hypothetical protein AAF220_11420, partial [Pseudomonadota bacterium]